MTPEVELGSLEPGQTFRFLSPYNPANVYMVILSQAGSDLGKVDYVLLNSGRHYTSRYTRSVEIVQCSLTVDE